MRVIDPVVLQQNSLHAGRDSCDRDLNFGVGSRNIVVMVVPQHDGGFVLRLRRQRIDVRRLAHAVGDNLR